MRYTYLNNSIANVIRFSVRVNEMLRAFTTPQSFWQLQPCFGNPRVGKPNFGNVIGKIAHGHYRPGISAVDLRKLATDIAGSLLPTLFVTSCGQTDKTVAPDLFQRRG